MPRANSLLSAGVPAGAAQALLGAPTTIALAGSTQTDATAITTACANITSGSGGARLPAMNVGDSVEVFNVSGNTASIYPATGQTINALSANGAISMATAKSAIFKCVSANQLRTIPLVPS